MKYKNIAAIAVITAMAASASTVLASGKQNVSGGYEWTENLNRGLAAVPVNDGIYLSWRLQANEDSRFGTAENNTVFDIYRDGQLIASEENTTNYLDKNGTVQSEYKVVPSGESIDEQEGGIDISGSTITVNTENKSAVNSKLYAVKYSENGSLERVQSFDLTKTGTSKFEADFEPDKALLWDGMQPSVLSGGELNNTTLMLGDGYLTVPLVKPEAETIYDNSGNETGTYEFSPSDCSAGDLDGDGEYEIVVKWISNELDVGNAGYSGTTRFAAYKLNGTKMWEQDINLGRNVFSSAHTAQFLVYDFDGDGKAEITCQTSRGSTDGEGEYVSKSANPKTNSGIYNLTDAQNSEADYRASGNGRVTTGDEFLTIFDGKSGKALDTIEYPTSRYNLRCWGKDDGGNRCNRFLATVAYLDGQKPYAVYWRGYYDYGSGRTGIGAVSFDGERLNVDYQFDTLKGQPGYHSELEDYSGQGNHSIVTADVDGDGKDEFISGALCMEVNDDNELMPKWCSWREHGDAHHIGDYDPTNPGLEYFSVHEHSGESHGKTLDYGMTVYDAATGNELFHTGASKDTGRGMMANVGAGGYYQIAGAGNYISKGGTSFETANISLGTNFRIYWDGDLYDELLDGTSVTSWNGSKMEQIFNADGCTKINGSKSNPSLQADLFGDWREEIVYPTTDGNALRVYTSTELTSYKMKSLMYDKMYREGVAAEQTAYNQPPHISYYLSEDSFYGNLSGIEIDTANAKTKYYLGEEFDKNGLKVIGKYTDKPDREVSDYSISGYDPMQEGEQIITIGYMGYSKEITVTVIGENGITAESLKSEYRVGEEIDKSKLSVKMQYADGSEKELSGYKLSGYDSMTAGEQTVNVSYIGYGGEYSTSIVVTIGNEFIIENGIVTGYSGEETEAVVPNNVITDGVTETVTGIADGAFAESKLSKIYIYSKDMVFEGDNIFPPDVTIMCIEGSSAQEYAESHNISYELIETGDSVTFDEEFYSDYAGKNMLMQSKSEGKLADEFVTYNTKAADSRGPWYKDNTYGFMVASGEDGNYLSVNAGIYDDMNKFNQVYITLNNTKTVNESGSIAFDVMMPSNGGSPYMEVQNSAGTVIDTISGLAANKWYRYEYTFNNGVYTRTVSKDGIVLSEDVLNVSPSGTIFSTIAFKQGFSWGSGGQNGIINIDNILIK